MKLIQMARWTLAVLALAAQVGCGGGGGGIGGTGASAGTLSVSLTDAPACGFDAVNVTVERVRVHQLAGADDADAGWSDIVLSPPRRVDLLSLTNGAMESLGQTSLPAGNYTQLRLVLAPNSAARPLANSVVPTGGAETPLTTPSGQQSGLKLNTNLAVPAGEVLDVALDFDACKSVVKRGASGQYNLKPVIEVVPLVSTAGLRVVGHVDPAIALASTQVSLQSNGVLVKATRPDSTGQFVLYPVPAGQYDLVMSAAGRVTAVVTGVPVTTAAATTVNSATMRFDPPVSAMRTVTGTVSPSAGTVRVLQSLAGGPTLEAAWVPVDGQSGAFSVDLPTGAPVRAAHAGGATMLSFSVEAAAANHYTVQATSSGAVQTRAVDTSAPVAPLSFVFP